MSPVGASSSRSFHSAWGTVLGEGAPVEAREVLRLWCFGVHVRHCSTGFAFGVLCPAICFILGFGAGLAGVQYCLRAALLTHAATQDIEQHMPDQPRRDHLAVVEESEVVCSQRCRQIGDLPIFE